MANSRKRTKAVGFSNSGLPTFTPFRLFGSRGWPGGCGKRRAAPNLYSFPSCARP